MGAQLGIVGQVQLDVHEQAPSELSINRLLRKAALLAGGFALLLTS
jgi:hypothetical protein